MSSPANTYYPDQVSLPGETLEEVLEDRQMSQAELAERTGRPRKTINEIIKGKTAITPETALQLERVLGVPASFWNKLERNYQDFLARKREEELFEASSSWLKEIPVAELARRGWIASKERKADLVREVLGFFGVASPDQWQQVFALPQASFRHSQSYASGVGALAAWLRKGELEAQKIRCAPYDRPGFQAALAEARRLTVEPPEIFLPRLVEICAEAGVAVAFVRELPKCRAHGATRWLSPTKALIQLSLRYKTDDHLWFTFFHEAGHILLHGKKLTFLEGEESSSSANEEEEANSYAADFLIPSEKIRHLVGQELLSKERVRTFARELDIAPGIVVGRLQHMRRLPHNHLNDLKVRLEWSQQ